MPTVYEVLTLMYILDPISRESTMDRNYFIHFPCLLSGKFVLVLYSCHCRMHHIADEISQIH